MGKFDASLKSIGDTTGLPATVELHEGRISIVAGDAEIGDWPVSEVGLEPIPSGYRLAAEGDHLLIEIDERERFAEELADATKKKGVLHGLFSGKDKEKSDEGGSDSEETAGRSKGAPSQPTGTPAVATSSDRAGESVAPDQVAERAGADVDTLPGVGSADSESEITEVPTSSEEVSIRDRPSLLNTIREKVRPWERPQRADEEAEGTVAPPDPEPKRSASTGSAPGNWRLPSKESAISTSHSATPPQREEKPGIPEEQAARAEETLSLFGRLVAALDRSIDLTEKRWGSLLPNWVFNRIIFVMAGVLVVLAVIFRGVTSLVLIVAGVVALMVGGVAYTDDVTASKILPGRTTPSHLLLGGLCLLALGILFGLLA